MSKNLGCHVIQFPSKRWGFVGSIPIALCSVVDAQKSDVMGGRAWKDEDGNLKVYKAPVFDTEKAAKEFAKSKKVLLNI